MVAMATMGQASRYRILRVLGSGGMAQVQLAEDTVLNRRVALKRLHSATDLPGIKRLRREALLGASLDHPNLVYVYDVWEERDGDLCMVMEYVAGNTLRDLIRDSGAIPAPRALPILSGVAAALDVVHSKGIVHRDVKPANVLLGVAGQIKLADLGVAAVDDHTQITTSGAVIGTFSYMAPEQLEGVSRSQPATDIYALAAVAFETLCGKKARPERNPLMLAHAIGTRPPPDLRDCLPGAPAAAADVLRQGMSANPAQRPRTAGELVATLRAALDPPRREVALAAPAAVAVPLANARDRPPRPAPSPAVRSSSSFRSRGGRQLDRSVGAGARPLPQTRYGSNRRLRPGLLALTALGAVIAAVVAVAVLSTGGGGAPHARNSHVLGHSSGRALASQRAARTGAGRPSSTQGPSAGASGAGSSTASGSASDASGGAAAAATLPGSAGSSGQISPSTPPGAVQTFYEDAARHDYGAAWALATPNLRGQEEGYGAFRSQMSAVRSITFHKARTVSGRGSSAATVALSTTAVQVDKTQNCSGTAQTVRTSRNTWLVDRIAISCTGA
jgi:eukaryotic-like serine/threonine-protein kinase